jgi:hypothetical protein
MRKAEAMAVAHHELDPNRADGRLFQVGPPDRFTTLREAELTGMETLTLIEYRRDISEDDSQPMPAVALELGSWEELMEQHGRDDEQVPEHHYSQTHYRPVETPEGARLGTALFVTEFPHLPPDFDDYVDVYGMDDSLYPMEARTLEMAHFATEEEARTFEQEFRSYLVPGMVEGP